MNGVLNENAVVKEFVFNKRDVHEIDYLLDDFIKDCRGKYFHTFENGLVYDKIFTNISHNEYVNFTITHRSMELKSEFSGLNKKTKMLEEMFFFYSNKQTNKAKKGSRIAQIPRKPLDPPISWIVTQSLIYVTSHFLSNSTYVIFFVKILFLPVLELSP